MAVSVLALAGWKDIFHEVLNHLRRPVDEVDHEEDYDGEIHRVALQEFRSTVLSLCLSCRALLDPSLDKLWHTLDDILPVLKLLPNYQLRGRGTHLLTGEISPGAWSRLRTYTNRVRSISLYTSYPRLEAGVWPAMLEKCQGALLFPKLQSLSLSLSHATPDSFLPIPCLVSPSLRYFSLTIHPDKEEDHTALTALAGATLQELSKICTGLTAFDFLPHMYIGPDHLRCLSRLPKLERLALDKLAPVDEVLLRSFANIKDLAALEVNMVAQPANSADCTPLHQTDGFSKLSKLELLGQPTRIARFLLAYTMPYLKDLSLCVGNHLGDDLVEHLPSLCQHLGPHTLTLLRVELGDFIHAPRFLMDVLEPLLSFTRLEKLELFLEEHIALRDDDLARLPSAWPNMRTLILIQSENSMSDPDRVPGSVERPTLNGLIQLARGLPHLVQLCIPDLDATSMPDVESVPLLAHSARNLCIQNLVGAEESERQLAVAVVLDRLFPRLRLEPTGLEWMPGYGESANPYVEDSENVTLLLRAMQVARRHYPGGVDGR